MNYENLAEEYFKKGYNCSQSVAAAFADVAGVDSSTLLRASCPFGGGFARRRNVCGAVSGMGLILGLVYADDSPDAKKASYALTQKLCDDFEQHFGSIICAELLSGAAGADSKDTSPVPGERNAEYYKKRKSCVDCVRYAAALLSREIEKDGQHV